MKKIQSPAFILVVALLAPSLLMAQAAEAKKEEQKKKEQDAPAPAPSTEQNFSIFADVGYRALVNSTGNFNTYRSVVNLGEGLKLFGLDLTINDPKSLLFDRLDIRAHGWGSEPWETARLDARKRNAYNLSVDYRNLAYFNYLPSFADPGAATGSLVSQRSFDTHMRLADVNLELFPQSWVRPFLNWDHASGSGNGVVTMFSPGNEYPVANWIRNKNELMRGGLILERKRWHATLEQGGLFFRDSSEAYTSAGRNAGNRPGTGQELNNLSQVYGTSGRSTFSRALFTANPFNWLDVTASFLYSQPWKWENFFESSTGRFLLVSNLTFYNGQRILTTGDSKLPRSSGNLGAELRPFRRMRIIETWFTDRLHNASSAFLSEQILLSGTNTIPRTGYFTDRTVWNYNQQEIDVLFDLSSKITLRGGHRYVWGDVSGYGGFLNPGPEASKLERNVGLAGLNVHLTRKLHSNLDLEVGRGDKNYFRTSLQNYTRLRWRQRYQVKENLSINTVYTLLDNENPLITSQYDFQSQDASASVLWNPTSLKRASVLGEYTWFRLRSSVDYRDPGFGTSMLSNYREQGHTANALFDLTGPKVGATPMHLSFGGSFYSSGGTRPADYYQPMARLLVPLRRNVALRSEWRYYGLSQQFYRYEGFTSHLFIISLQVTR